MKNKYLVLITTIMLVLSTGCEKKLENRNISKIKIDEPKKESKIDEPIIKDETLKYYDELLNSKENIGFLLSTYSSIQKIDFKDLLIEFPSNYSSKLDAKSAEYSSVTKTNPKLTGDIYKLTSSNLKNYIQTKTGYALEEFNKNNLSQVVYMEAYDAYYTNQTFLENAIDTYKVVNEDNIYYIYYRYNNNKYKLIMKKVNNKYYFDSNLLNN